MAQTELAVFAYLGEGFVPAGLATLTETSQGVEASFFAYGTRYLDRPGAFEVDPVSLSLADREAVRGKRLFPANGLPQFGGIRDAAPDAWGVNGGPFPYKSGDVCFAAIIPGRFEVQAERIWNHC
jgi:serine/threonine-protein kinase HipA